MNNPNEYSNVISNAESLLEKLNNLGYNRETGFFEQEVSCKNKLQIKAKLWDLKQSIDNFQIIEKQ